MSWIEPITDRTQADVDRAKYLISKGYVNLTAEEKAEWDAGLKGCFNRSDAERIVNNINLLAEVLEITVPTWVNIPYTPLTQDIDYHIRYPIQRIRESYSVYDTTPEVPGYSNHWDYQKINDLEQILKDVYTIVESNFYYNSTDEITMGDSVGLIL